MRLNLVLAAGCTTGILGFCRNVSGLGPVLRSFLPHTLMGEWLCLPLGSVPQHRLLVGRVEVFELGPISSSV